MATNPQWPPVEIAPGDLVTYAGRRWRVISVDSDLLATVRIVGHSRFVKRTVPRTLIRKAR